LEHLEADAELLVELAAEPMVFGAVHAAAFLSEVSRLSWGPVGIVSGHV